MTEEGHQVVHFADIANIVMCWNQPEDPVHSLVPDPDRIQLIVRPGYNPRFRLAITCKDAYQKAFWVKTNYLRWTEIRDALRNLVSRVVAGQLPIFVSHGRVYYVCEEKRNSRIQRLRNTPY